MEGLCDNYFGYLVRRDNMTLKQNQIITTQTKMTAKNEIVFANQKCN